MTQDQFDKIEAAARIRDIPRSRIIEIGALREAERIISETSVRLAEQRRKARRARDRARRSHRNGNGA